MTYDADWYRKQDWSKTSFADVTEAAVHYALIEFTLALQHRIDSEGRSADQSDIFKEYRRTIAHIARGQVDAAEWLAEREAGH
jgi:hypothetical protein